MLSTQTGIYFAFFAGLGVLVIMVAFFFISALRGQGRRLEEIKAQVLREVSLIEEERIRISVDLHDDIGSTLASVRMALENLLSDHPGNERIKKTIGHVETTRQRIRQIAHNLMPGILLSRGLCAAIQDLGEETEAASGIKVHFNNDCNDQDFDPEKSIMVFRVIQEILSNAIKHAGGNQIVITCTCRSDLFSIDISDNGKGFDPGWKARPGKHLGLHNINTRLAILHAAYRIHSTPATGTRYSIEIPLNTMI